MFCAMHVLCDNYAISCLHATKITFTFMVPSIHLQNNALITIYQILSTVLQSVKDKFYTHSLQGLINYAKYHTIQNYKNTIINDHQLLYLYIYARSTTMMLATLKHYKYLLTSLHTMNIHHSCIIKYSNPGFLLVDFTTF